MKKIWYRILECPECNNYYMHPSMSLRPTPQFCGRCGHISLVSKIALFERKCEFVWWSPKTWFPGERRLTSDEVFKEKEAAKENKHQSLIDSCVEILNGDDK